MSRLGDNNRGSLPAAIARGPGNRIVGLDYDALAALPSEARRIMREECPMDFDAVDFLKQWQKVAMSGMPREQMIAELRAHMRDRCAQLAAHDYGPAHPQAMR